MITFNILSDFVKLVRRENWFKEFDTCYLYENGEFIECDYTKYDVLFREDFSEFGGTARMIYFETDSTPTYLNVDLPKDTDIPLYVRNFIVKATDKEELSKCSFWGDRHTIDNCYVMYTHILTSHGKLEDVYIKDEIKGEREALYSRLLCTLHLNSSVRVEEIDSEFESSSFMKYVLSEVGYIDEHNFDIHYSLYDVPEVENMWILFVDSIKKGLNAEYTQMFYGFIGPSNTFTNYGELR